MKPSCRLFLLAILSAALLSACGVRYVYSQLDWIVPWQLRDYVSLEREQRDRFDEWLAGRLQWHCSTQLGNYADVLRGLSAELETGGRHERLVAHADRAEALWRTLMSGMAKGMPELVADLEAHQFDEIHDALQAKNVEVRETFLEGDAKARAERRVERTEKRLRRWFGRLDAEQRAALDRWSSELNDNAEAWWTHRLESQRALLDWLQRASNGEMDAPGRRALEHELGELLAYPDARWSDAYADSVRANRDRSLALFLELYELGDTAQRERVRERLDSLAGQFERLVCS